MPAVTADARSEPVWHPSGWRSLPEVQAPGWQRDQRLQGARERLASSRPLVSSGEIALLRSRLAEVARGRAAIVQAGDCAETFRVPTRAGVGSVTSLLHRSVGVLADALGVPTLPIGRIAGQFAKPRSSPVETVDGRVLPAFRGHLVNDSVPEASARLPDPDRLVRGHRHAARTLALLRQVAAEGHPMQGPGGRDLPALWTSHEALVLDYEEPQTRWDPAREAWALTSTHLPWIGERTRDPAGAHVRFLAGVANPVACKVGPGMTRDEIVRLATALDPNRQPGRLVLIIRMGAGRVRATLPGLVAAVRSAGHPVVWLCDPMHGNTVLATGGRKTRHVGTVLAEIEGFVDAVRSAGEWPGGLHLETTPEPVTECIGGRCGITDGQVGDVYLSDCDPRLNADQSLEVVERYAALLRSH